MAMTNVSEIDAAVLAEINKRTLVGGTLIDTAPIAEEVGISQGQLADSLHRLLAKGYAVVSGSTASITPSGHASLA